jgi:hypothetical protein
MTGCIRIDRRNKLPQCCHCRHTQPSHHSDRIFPGVEDAIEKAHKNVVALLGAKNFLEGKVSLGVDEDVSHGSLCAGRYSLIIALNWVIGPCYPKSRSNSKFKQLRLPSHGWLHPIHRQINNNTKTTSRQRNHHALRDFQLSKY